MNEFDSEEQQHELKALKMKLYEDMLINNLLVYREK